MTEAAAFDKAAAELGDVSALADEISLKRRREVYEEAYLGIRRYMKAPRVAAWVIFGALLLSGLVAAAIAYFSPPLAGLGRLEQYGGLFGTIMASLCLTVPAFCFLGLTQESASHYPMSKKRAAWYTLAAFLLSAGISLLPLTYFSTGHALNGSGLAIISALGILMPFVIPGAALLVFLCLTEKDRSKPWTRELRSSALKHEMEIWNDPATANRFGLFSGAIWIFAAGLFLVLGFSIGFRFSWLAFVFATAFQLLVQGMMTAPRRGAEEQDGAKS
jgi:hypothetical protein